MTQRDPSWTNEDARAAIPLCQREDVPRRNDPKHTRGLLSHEEMRFLAREERERTVEALQKADYQINRE